MPDPNIEILLKETYFKTIENSIGTSVFNTLYVRHKDTGDIVDVLDDGKLSCAYFVSSILFLFSYIERSCATVQTLDRFLQDSKDWKLVGGESIERGDVIIWQEIVFEDNLAHEHIGFALDETDAVSTSYKTKTVVKHPISNQGIKKVYRRMF
jgi:hypothetical protein